MTRGRWAAALPALLLVALLSACQGQAPEAGPGATPEVPGTGAEATATPTPAPAETPAATPTGEAPPTAAPTPYPAPTEAASPTPTGEPAPVEAATPRVEVVATGLEVPWALAWTPDGRLFVTERPGRVRVVVDGELQPEPVAEIPVAAVGEGGLMGLAVDPHFDANGYVYTMYTYSVGGNLANRISRWVLREGRLEDESVLVDDIPGARIHDGGRIAFGPDGMLYATTGDAAQGELSQDPESLAGKVLRLNPDGSVPEDNPFAGSPVYAYGLRNPQGLDWHPETGALLATEHGPSGEGGLCCRDEVNVIRPGANYGWPIVAGEASDERFVDPLLSSGPTDTWAPAGAAFYDGTAPAAWRGSYFFGALRGRHLHRLALGDDDGLTVVEAGQLFEGEYGRLRAVAMGPDGHLYVTTSNRDGRGQPAPEDDRILRIVAGE